VRFLNAFQDRLLFGTDIRAPDSDTPRVDLLIELRDATPISKTVFNKIA
jgi:hypothetical protein